MFPKISGIKKRFPKSSNKKTQNRESGFPEAVSVTNDYIKAMTLTQICFISNFFFPLLHIIQNYAENL